MTRFGSRPDSLADLMAEAARGALTAAGLERPEALVVSAMNPEEFVGEGNFASHVATHVGLARTPSLRAETATSSGAAALFTAFAMVSAGVYRSVLVVGGEKMTHLPTPRVSELIGRSIDAYERSYGATMPARAGLVTRAWMARTGATLRDISLVAVKNHAHAARNPWAHFREPVTLDAVMDSRLVADRCASSTAAPSPTGRPRSWSSPSGRRCASPGSARAPTTCRCATATSSRASARRRRRRGRRTGWRGSGPSAW